jgi:hypothetical protein
MDEATVDVHLADVVFSKNFDAGSAAQELADRDAEMRGGLFRGLSGGGMGWL